MYFFEQCRGGKQYNPMYVPDAVIFLYLLVGRKKLTAQCADMVGAVNKLNVLQEESTDVDRY